MNHNPPSPRRQLYELLEVLRPDFDEQAGVALKEDNDLGEAREKMAELLQKHPDLIDSELIDTWHHIAGTDEQLGEAIQDIAVPEHVKQEILTMVEDHKSSVQAQASRYEQFASRFISHFNTFMLGFSVAILLIVLTIWWIKSDS